MNRKMGLMMAMGLLISAPLLSKDYLISTPRTSLLITANKGEKSKMQYYGVSITPVQIQNIAFLRIFMMPVWLSKRIVIQHSVFRP